jgi:hypothetical protein
MQGVNVTDDELVTAVCEYLATALGSTWPGPYSSSQVGVFYGPIGSAPDRAVGVTLYSATEAVPADGYPMQWRRVQVRIRGARNTPNGADVLASQVKTALSNLSRTAGINNTQRVLVAPLGADGNGRTERADSYSITLDNPEA